MSNAAVLGHGLLEKGSSKHHLQAQKMRNRFMEIFVTNNIMLLKDSPHESLDPRVVDFDWAGQGGGEREKINFVILQTETQISSGLVKQEEEEEELIEDGPMIGKLVSSWLFAKGSQKTKTRG